MVGGLAPYSCPSAPQPNHSGPALVDKSEGEFGPGFVQPVAIAGGRPRRWTDLRSGTAKDAPSAC
jgi:hypothetical protein